MTVEPRFRVLGLSALCLLALAAPASACLWYYGKNIRGDEITFDGHSADLNFTKHLVDQSEHQSKLTIDTSREPGPETDFKVRSDFAATLIHQGKASRAIPILEEIEGEHPSEYIIAVNLGTAYELAGDNEKALQWIREGIRRNPNSHMGTEWLHVKILEAKIAAAKDPSWIQTHSVLGIDFGSGDIPDVPARLPSGQDRHSIAMALRYQLHERLAFVPPPDPLVAGMIGDLADLMGLMYTADHALPLYDLALSYKPVHADVLIRRRTQALKFVGTTVRGTPGEHRQQILVVGIAVAAALGAILLFLGRGLRRSKPAA